MIIITTRVINFDVSLQVQTMEEWNASFVPSIYSR